MIESEDPLIDLLTRDITDGIAGTGVRAAIVKFACERTPLGEDAHRMAAAVAEVYRRTGVPLLVHSDPFDSSGGNGQPAVARAGGRRSRVVSYRVRKPFTDARGR